MHRAATLAWSDPQEDTPAPVPWNPATARPLAVLGPAGSGKSTAVRVALQQALDHGARAVCACPTRMLVATYKAKMPDLDVDSVHSVFRLFAPETETLQSMTFFDLVVIEEVSQLSCDVFERLLRLWDAAGRRPVLVFVGDFAQLRGVDPTQARDSARWPQVVILRLHEMRRCACATLRWKLELLRTAKPTRRQLARILRSHKAPSARHRRPGHMAHTPSDEELCAVFMERPTTTFVTISRAAAARINQAALRHFFREMQPLLVIGGDPESNAENYRGHEQISNDPLSVPIYAGMRLTLTRNVNKDLDFVNGMGATALGACNVGVHARTDTGRDIVIYPWTEEDKTVFYPLRPNLSFLPCSRQCSRAS